MKMWGSLVNWVIQVKTDSATGVSNLDSLNSGPKQSKLQFPHSLLMWFKLTMR